MNPKICVSIPVTGIKETRELTAEACEKGADYIEYRLDYLKGPADLEVLAKTANIPKIATLRTRAEGGLSNLNSEERYHILHKAAESGFEYVDLELSMKEVEKKTRAIKEDGVKIIISKHFLEETPDEQSLMKTLDAEIKAGADVCKIVSTAKTYEDNLKILNFISSASIDAELVCFAMGPQGKLSRILAPYLGSSFMYASLKKELEAAPGQMTIKDLQNVYTVLSDDA